MKFLQPLPKDTTKQVATGWQTLNKHWIIKTANILVVVFTIASILALVFYWRFLPAQVPLWYSQPWGEDQLASAAWLFVLPATSIIWYSINVLLSVYLTLEYRVFSQVLFLSSVAVSFLSFLTLIQILLLVT